MLAKIFQFIGPVAGSLKGHVNRAELFRALTASGAASGLMAVLVAVLNSLSANAPAIFPGDAPAAVLVLGLALDLLRRMGHGPEPEADPKATYRGTGVDH